MEHFVLLGRESNFARAADLACLSPSAFSRSIQALEESLGLRLIDCGLQLRMAAAVHSR